MYAFGAEKLSAFTEHVRQTNRPSMAVGSGISSLSAGLAAAASTSAGPVGDGVTSLATQLAAMSTGGTTTQGSGGVVAGGSRSLASLQALASASMMDKHSAASAAGMANDRLKLETTSLESILPTLNGPAVSISSVSIYLMHA